MTALSFTPGPLQLQMSPAEYREAALSIDAIRGTRWAGSFGSGPSEKEITSSGQWEHHRKENTNPRYVKGKEVVPWT